VIEALDTKNIRMCLDTEHMWARGVNLWDETVRQEFLDEFAGLIELVHLNVPDHGVLLGSHIDRHNVPFEERSDLKHEGLIQDLAQWPLILERRSLSVQESDNRFVREVLGQPLERARA
jgi:endonuclease IV